MLPWKRGSIFYRYMRICSKCKEEKSLDYYIKHTAQCRTCRSAIAALLRTKESYKSYRKTYNDVYRAQPGYKERDSEYHRKRRQSGKHLEVNATYRKKRYADPSHRLMRNLRSSQNSVLKGKQSTTKGLGCDGKFLKEYLEEQFTEGMTWDNYGLGGWTIDHKLPLDLIKTNPELIPKIIHYTNLQPMWHIDNIKKGKKIC